MESRAYLILVLYADLGPRHKMRLGVRRHLETLEAAGVRHRVIYYNAQRGAPAWLRHFPLDALILHTTFLCMRWAPYFRDWKRKLSWIRDLDCVKIAFPQDEYDHAHTLDEWLREWRVSVIFSIFDTAQRNYLYPSLHDRVEFHRCLTGYIDGRDAAKHRMALRPLTERPIDLVYRATRLPYWFGSHGQLKHQIGEAVLRRAKSLGLRADVSTRPEDTIVGDRWLDFLASGRAVIGCESGSSVLDREGEIRARVDKLVKDNPGISFEELHTRMPHGWDDYRFFAVSPRHLEAIVTRTCQILVEGSYSGVLVPERHYIPLKRNLSNLDDVLSRLRDPLKLEDMVNRAYQDIYVGGQYSYQSLARNLESVISVSTETREAGTPFGSVAWRIGQAAGAWASIWLLATRQLGSLRRARPRGAADDAAIVHPIS